MRNSNTKSSFLIVVLFVLCLVQVGFATQYQYDNLNRLSKATYDDGTKIVYSYDASGNRSQKVITSQADLDLDVKVNAEDFSVLASQWLSAPGIPSADIAPVPDGDGIVDILDLAVLAEYWLEGTTP